MLIIFKPGHRIKSVTGLLSIPLFLMAMILPFTGVTRAQADAAPTAETSSAASGMNFYFGNLHSHTAYSDGTGTPAEAFAWARDTAGFDFYAITDHAEYLTPEEWEDIGASAELYNSPGQFLALRGFEWSHPDGHINVFDTSDYTDSLTTSTLESFY